MSDGMKKLMILDGNSIVNRAFFGMPALNAPDGTPTNAVYGFLTILQRLLDDEKPDGVCVTFDVHAPTFRHEMSAAYKAQRKPMPDDLRTQMPILKEVLDAMGIRRYEQAGWEADDLLGTMARVCEENGWACRLVTGDKDSFQLVTDTTHVIHIKTRMGRTETIEYTPERFFEEYGMQPLRMVDLKALMGDSSDNIAGVPGIGEKTAMDLLHHFTTLDGVYENLQDESIKPGQRKKLTEGEASARESYILATIRRDAPVTFVPQDAAWAMRPSGELYNICKKLGFLKLIEKWKLTPDDVTVQLHEAQLLPERELNAQEILDAIRQAPCVAVVPEDGLDDLCLCDGKSVFHLRWAQAGDEHRKILKELFSVSVPKAAHELKELMSLLLEEELPAEGFVFDTALAAYLLEATASDYSLQRITMKYCGTELSGAQAVYELYKVLPALLEEKNLTKLFEQAELPLCRVLADMEKTGFLVNRTALNEFGHQLEGEIFQLQSQIWEMAGGEFNINSPKQLGEVLFDRLGLPSGKKTRTGWSTNADVLQKVKSAHPIVPAVLRYRELAKLKSTYTDGLLKTIRSDGRIHTTFMMTATDTGRLSSREPNLQNIPIRKELGAAVRRMFVAAPGKVLVDADYSQIELRLLAHIAQDETMIQAFLSGEDIHAVTAGQVFGIPTAEVTPALRSQAKAVNFGIVYGISAFSLSDDIGVSRAVAQQYIDTYMEKYHGVREYMQQVIEKAKQDGYTTTLFGRRRALPELTASNFNIRAFGERVARNMPIQGTAADVMKLAMIRVYDRLARELPEAKLLLQVHDELIVECPAEQAQQASVILKEEMEAAAQFSVPLRADVGVGSSWAEAH